jgi:hypothetical protein
MNGFMGLQIESTSFTMVRHMTSMTIQGRLELRCEDRRFGRSIAQANEWASHPFVE